MSTVALHSVTYNLRLYLYLAEGSLSSLTSCNVEPNAHAIRFYAIMLGLETSKGYVPVKFSNIANAMILSHSFFNFVERLPYM